MVNLVYDVIEFYITLKKEINMSNSNNISYSKPSFLVILLFTFLGAFIMALGLSAIYDVVNVYSLEQDGFKISENFLDIGTMGGNIFGVVLIFALSMFFLLAVGIEIYKEFNLYFKTYLIVVSLIVALFSIFVVNFTPKDQLLVKSAQRVYDKIAATYEDPTVFTNSTPAKEYKLALDTKNFETLKVFVNNPKKIKGLDESDMFNKLLTVQNISNKSVREDFNKIYSDRYITQEEYESFKKNAMENIMNTMTADVQVNPSNDKLLLGNL